MDRKLLDILVCPATRQPLVLLEPTGLAAAVVARHRGGDDRLVLLAEEGIATAQLDAFPRA